MKSIISIVLSVLLFFAFNAFAAEKGETFTVNGYSIYISYRQSHEKFKVRGEITGGENCERMNVDIFLKIA